VRERESHARVLMYVGYYYYIGGIAFKSSTKVWSLRCTRVRGSRGGEENTRSIGHTVRRTMLLSSETLTGLLWEDDSRIMLSDKLMNATVRALNRILFVFHPPVREPPSTETKDPRRSAIGRDGPYVQRHARQEVVRSGHLERAGGSREGVGQDR